MAMTKQYPARWLALLTLAGALLAGCGGSKAKDKEGDADKVTAVPVEVRRRDGKTYYVLSSVPAFRDGVGRLLAEVQRIKSEGDYAAAKAFFASYGTRFDPALRDEVVRRVDALGLPSYSCFVMPALTPVPDEAGEITDVQISYPCDLATQMLDWSTRYRPLG